MSLGRCFRKCFAKLRKENSTKVYKSHKKELWARKFLNCRLTVVVRCFTVGSLRRCISTCFILILWYLIKVTSWNRTQVNESLDCNSIADIVPLSQSRKKSDKTPSLCFLFNTLPPVSQYGLNTLQSYLVKHELWFFLAPNTLCLHVKLEITAKAGPPAAASRMWQYLGKKPIPSAYILVSIFKYTEANSLRF